MIVRAPFPTPSAQPVCSGRPLAQRSFASSAFAVANNARPTARRRDVGFTASELRKFRALKTPAGVQGLLDGLPYNLSYTARSPKRVLHDRTASCLEGGIFAAAALRVLGFPPL